MGRGAMQQWHVSAPQSVLVKVSHLVVFAGSMLSGQEAVPLQLGPSVQNKRRQQSWL